MYRDGSAKNYRDWDGMFRQVRAYKTTQVTPIPTSCFGHLEAILKLVETASYSKIK